MDSYEKRLSIKLRNYHFHIFGVLGFRMAAEEEDIDALFALVARLQAPRLERQRSDGEAVVLRERCLYSCKYTSQVQT